CSQSGSSTPVGETTGTVPTSGVTIGSAGTIGTSGITGIIAGITPKRITHGVWWREGKSWVLENLVEDEVWSSGSGHGVEVELNDMGGAF
ncbi:hypothetical protein Tco_1196713, partial [Tanacetum coccineum]